MSFDLSLGEEYAPIDNTLNIGDIFRSNSEFQSLLWRVRPEAVALWAKTGLEMIVQTEKFFKAIKAYRFPYPISSGLSMAQGLSSGPSSGLNSGTSSLTGSNVKSNRIKGHSQV